MKLSVYNGPSDNTGAQCIQPFEETIQTYVHVYTTDLWASVVKYSSGVELEKCAKCAMDVLMSKMSCHLPRSRRVGVITITTATTAAAAVRYRLT